MSEYSNVIYSRIKIYPDSIENEIFKLIDECYTSEYGLETSKLIDVFYQNVNSEDIDDNWLLSNIGSKTIKIDREDEIITTETEHFVPNNFLLELYKISTGYDSDASVYCKYYDENFNLVGGIILKDGIICEKDECLSLEIPEEDDPNYDLFVERMWKIVINSQDDYIDYCEKSIDELVNQGENLKYNDCRIEVVAKKVWIFNQN
jgi:hypothetical protein